MAISACFVNARRNNSSKSPVDAPSGRGEQSSQHRAKRASLARLAAIGVGACCQRTWSLGERMTTRFGLGLAAITSVLGCSGDEKAGSPAEQGGSGADSAVEAGGNADSGASGDGD